MSTILSASERSLIATVLRRTARIGGRTHVVVCPADYPGQTADFLPTDMDRLAAAIETHEVTVS